MRSCELFERVACSLGESPVWDERLGGLYWLDIVERTLFFKALDTRRLSSWALPNICSAIFLTDDKETLLLASEGGLLAFRLRGNKFNVIATQFEPRQGWRTNDGGVDPHGRVWFGSMSSDPAKIPGEVYQWLPNSDIKKIWEHVHIPNTFVWTRDGRYMLSADSFKHEIRRFRYDVDEGIAIFDQLIVDLSNEGFEPDGSSIDICDTLWNAQWNGRRIAGYDTSGKLLEIIDVPVSRPTSCCFGGPDMKTLFVTTASTGLSVDEQIEQPLAGAVFCVAMDAPGLTLRKVALSALESTQND